MIVYNKKRKQKTYVIGKGLCYCKSKKGKGIGNIVDIAASLGRIGYNVGSIVKDVKKEEVDPKMLMLIREIEGKGFNIK